jgi:hypothetical protein
MCPSELILAPALGGVEREATFPPRRANRTKAVDYLLERSVVILRGRAANGVSGQNLRCGQGKFPQIANGSRLGMESWEGAEDCGASRTWCPRSSRDTGPGEQGVQDLPGRLQPGTASQGRGDGSAAAEFLYSSDDGDLMAIRINQWKIAFKGQNHSVQLTVEVLVVDGTLTVRVAHEVVGTTPRT